MADRYFCTGQVFITNGTATVVEAGRIAAAGNTTLNITDPGGGGQFTITMANGTSGTLTSGTSTVTDSPVTLSAGDNVITIAGSGTATLNLTLGSGANTNSINSWSDASGGAVGASIPTSADNAYFDANSYTAASQTATVDAAMSCLDMIWTGATNTPTLAFGDSLSCFSNVTMIAGMSTSGTGYLQLKSVGAANISILPSLPNRVFFGGVGSFTLLQNLTTSVQVNLDAGTLDTNGKTVTCSSFNSSNVSVRTLTSGASIFTCGAWSITDATNLTITANTATINISGTGALAGGDVDYNGADFNLNGTAHTLSGDFTCATLALSSGTTQAITMTAGQVITCTTVTLSGDATHAHTIVSGTAGTLAQIWATNHTDDYVTYTDILRNYNGVIVSDCDGAGGGTFAGGGGTFTSLTIQGAGAHALTITGSNTFALILVDTTEEAKTITGTAGTTQTIRRLHKTDNPNVLTMNSTGAAWTIAGHSGYFEGDFMDLTNVVATEPNLYYAGDNSTDGTGNTNWVFSRRIRQSFKP